MIKPAGGTDGQKLVCGVDWFVNRVIVLPDFIRGRFDCDWHCGRLAGRSNSERLTNSCAPGSFS